MFQSIWEIAIILKNVTVAYHWIKQRFHDDVIKLKHFPRYWQFVRRIHRSPVNSPHKGHWRGALMFSLICAWINVWVNNGEAGYSRRHGAHYDVTLMPCDPLSSTVHHDSPHYLKSCPFWVSKYKFIPKTCLMIRFASMQKRVWYII